MATEEQAKRKPYIEPQSETHRAMGVHDLADLVRKGDPKAVFEMARRGANRERKNS